MIWIYIIWLLFRFHWCSLLAFFLRLRSWRLWSFLTLTTWPFTLSCICRSTVSFLRVNSVHFHSLRLILVLWVNQSSSRRYLMLWLPSTDLTVGSLLQLTSHSSILWLLKLYLVLRLSLYGNFWRTHLKNVVLCVQPLNWIPPFSTRFIWRR